ncbi:MAG: hypothetical protein JWR69_4802, partial [Pedosphaera sp.]|nr:hypothetical protein [Pedosphaera sp.]
LTPSTVPTPLLLRTWNDPANQEFSEFIAQLRRLQDLPTDLRNSSQAKAFLIGAVFEGCPERRIQPARSIIQALESGVLSQDSLNQREAGEDTTVATDRFLSHRLKGLAPAALALRMRTGLDALPKSAELDLKPAENVRQLLAQLRNDQEHEGLARVVRDIMAALYLPRSLSEIDELALGGFSDISNRGTLDRLLPSELANDDVTLAVRVALNEALYFRREPPATHPPGRFAVLLDAGVRTWGLPRIFATAVALALMAKEDRQGEVTTWRATPEGVEKIDLLTRAGLIAHLGVLQTYAQPGGALAPFFTQFADDPGVETVLVTQRDTLDDPDFQLRLREVTSQAFYIASVDRDGSFEMFLHPHRHSLLCQAVISLESLFSKPNQPSAPLRDKPLDPNLPLIFSIRPFPFLLPIVGKMQKAIRYSKEGGIAVMRDRRLLRWESNTQGAELLVSDLPKGNTLWLGTTEDGRKIHVLKQRGNQPLALLTTWDSVTGSLRTQELPLPDSENTQVLAQGGLLYLIARQMITAFDMDSGAPLGKLLNPDPRLHSHGRFFSQPNGSWAFLTYNGEQLHFEPLTLDPRVAQADVLALFDREGFEGPWALTKKGEVFSNTGERQINLGRLIHHYEISPEGDRLLVPGIGDSPNNQLIDLRNNRCSFMSKSESRRAFNPQIIPPTTSLRVRFDAVLLTAARGLWLRDIKGVWWCLTESDGHTLRLIEIKPDAREVAAARKFERTIIPAEHPFTLKVVTWPDGRRVWLDSRGLLHLRSADASEPEISLVLSDGFMAAWSSDGRMAGSSFFIPPGSETISPLAMLEKIYAISPGP